MSCSEVGQRVNVIFFASLREAMGTHAVEVNARNAVELFDALSQHLGADAVRMLKGKNIRMAVNQEMVDGPVNFNADDEIAFLPPVTGG